MRIEAAPLVTEGRAVQASYFDWRYEIKNRPPLRPRLSATTPSFLFSARCELLIGGYEGVALSAPALSNGARLNEKDLLAAGRVSEEGKYTLDEHLEHLHRNGRVGADRPLLVLGLRNNLVNLRTPLVLDGRVHAVEREEPERSRRPYYGIGARGGRLVMGEALGNTDERWAEFFCAGVPVLWDDLKEETLLDVMLTEAADHSHIFDLPRGQHPSATDAARAAWSCLHDAFLENLYSDRQTAITAMRAAVAAIDPPLRRSDDYLHAVLGIRDDGALFCLFANGRLEALGHIARDRGCRRAVCVENSGSIMPTYLPHGLAGDRIPLLRAPNFRPRGRVVLALQLETASFRSYPISST